MRQWLVFGCLCAALVGALPGRMGQAAPAACPWQDPALRAQMYSVAERVWRRNLSRRLALVHPSRAYAGVWLRDSFWTFLAIGDRRLGARALANFTAQQLPTGQLPTQFTIFLQQPIYRHDESTLLYLIWAAWETEAGGPTAGATPLRSALAYNRSRASGGLYRSAPGSYRSWFDSYRLPSADTLSYNQGLYAVALRAARVLSLPVEGAEIAAAEGGYRSLVDHTRGYLRFSTAQPYHDISGLAGEFLSLWLFRRPILDDRAVAETLRQQPAFRGGFRVVTAADGSPLPSTRLIVSQYPGDYQNGASWLLYDQLALASGYLHRLPGMGTRLRARLLTEFAAGATYHEYLNTNPISPFFGTEPAWRDDFSWDTFVLRIDDAVGAARCAAIQSDTAHSPAAQTG